MIPGIIYIIPGTRYEVFYIAASGVTVYPFDTLRSRLESSPPRRRWTTFRLYNIVYINSHTRKCWSSWILKTGIYWILKTSIYQLLSILCWFLKTAFGMLCMYWYILSIILFTSDSPGMLNGGPTKLWILWDDWKGHRLSSTPYSGIWRWILMFLVCQFECYMHCLCSLLFVCMIAYLVVLERKYIASLVHHTW